MAEVIIMPKLGYNMDEGQLVKWCKHQGDAVQKGDVLFEINTDKTTMPVEATRDGVLLKTMLEEGEFAPVFTPIAVIGDAGEDADAALASFQGGAESQAEVAETEEQAQAPAQPVEAVPDSDGAAAAVKDLKLTPKAKKLVRDEGIDPASLTGIKGTGFRGGLTAKDIKASPLARKVAAKLGVDLADVDGSGVGGKIVRADVEAACAAQAEPCSQGKKVLSRTPYKGVRKIIGDRLSESMFTAPHLYFTDSVDTGPLMDFRKELNAQGEARIAVSDLLVMAASKALQAYPEVNASLVGDEIVAYKSVNVGMAVAGDNGLVVPVVKDTQEKSLSAIARETRDLVARAKEGRLDAGEYSGGTFTISNLGMFGIENFTAIINPPESAILSVSSVRKTPVVVENEDGGDEIAIRPMMNITLSADHRVIDGLLAAQFLGRIKSLLENPLTILM